MKTILYLTALVLAFAFRALAQGTFQNLSFESANLPILLPGQSGGVVPATDAIPGWQGYLGANQTFGVFFNDVSLGAPAISIHSSSSSFTPIAGNYSVILQPQFNPNNLPGRDSAAVAQTGQIPAVSQSLRFYSGSGSMQVSFAGQNIPLAQLGITGNYLILGGDISAFAGQTGELRFTVPSGPFSYNIPYLDSIVFSTQSIPEPSTFGLFGLGAFLFGFRARAVRVISPI